MITAVCAIILFFIMILPHEFGHFIVAKSCDVKINEFSMGMGPAIFKKQKGETLYSLRVLPIGGYCAMEGEDEASEDERAFVNKKAGQKAAILVAGSAMNVVTAIIIMIGLAFYTGVATTQIGDVQAGSPAEKAGIKAGDVLISVDGQKVKEWNDLSEIVAETKNEPFEVTVLRNDAEKTFKTSTEQAEDGRKIIGVTTAVSHNVFKCIAGGVKNTWFMTKTLVTTFAQLFTGKLGLDTLGGPVAIVKVAGDAGKVGISSFLYLAAFISINLAIFNMFPFPALDGGRLLFVIIRKITGKEVNSTIENKIHFIGLMLLFALMIFVTFNDVLRLTK